MNGEEKALIDTIRKKQKIGHWLRGVLLLRTAIQ